MQIGNVWSSKDIESLLFAFLSSLPSLFLHQNCMGRTYLPTPYIPSPTPKPTMMVMLQKLMKMPHLAVSCKTWLLQTLESRNRCPLSSKILISFYLFPFVTANFQHSFQGIFFRPSHMHSVWFILIIVGKLICNCPWG